MAQKTFYREQNAEREVKTVNTVISLTGAADPANTVITRTGGTNAITSITRTGVGVFRILLSEAYPSLVGFSLSGGDATTIDLVPKFEAEDVNGTTPFFDFKLAAGAVDTDVADAATYTVSVILKLKNSTQNT